MKLNAYSIFDRKALQYNAPFYQSTDGAAVRSLSDLVNDQNTTVGRHPSDFVLYCVGSYDDQSAIFVGEQPVRHIMDAIALVKIQPSLFQEAAQ